MRIPIVELEPSAPENTKRSLAHVLPGSVLVAVERQGGIFVDFEGGLYERSNALQLDYPCTGAKTLRPPSPKERDDYAVRAAGRAKERYPTVARIFLPSMEGLRDIGHVDTETWIVEWRKNGEAI